ncbi:MAG: Glu-tRNA(Gln) amidotransferase subunit GatD [Candidatus Diapherotrites archaeon]|nr:Glu-tRNA(Gln) amidotransferase subunit GatD [Candidatus Diapherotrites archaeon]
MNIDLFLEEQGLKLGDRVMVSEKGKAVLEGTLAPSEAKGTLVIKTDAGYKAGFSLESPPQVKKVGEGKPVAKKPPVPVPFREGLPGIVVLHTGGTIASRVDYAVGGVIASFSPQDLVSLVPEITEFANVDCVMVSNMMSEDMRFADYKRMAQAIEEQVRKGVKGIIVGHGTDTMAYSAAALSFMLRNLPVPVLLVGSQRSTDRPSTDAVFNLLNAAYFIVNTDYCGVGVCMHESVSDGWCVVLPGARTKKLHTSRRDSFKSVNALPVARVNFEEKKIEYFSPDYFRRSAEPLKVLPEFESRVGILKVFPGMGPEFFDFFSGKGFKGMVLEGTGLGHAPTNTPENQPNYEAIKRFIAKGGVVAITSQCIFGRVNPSVYTNLRRLSQIGCIFCGDMTTEAAYVKLAWLLGNFSAEQARKMMVQDLAGELSERSLMTDLAGSP